MSPDYRIPTPISPGDLDRAAGVLASAFHDDPLWQFLIPETGRREQTLDAFFRAVLTFSFTNQSVYGAGEPLAAVAVWGFPGQAKAKVASQVLVRFLKLAAGPFLFSAFRARGVFSRFERMQKKYAPDPHYYLQTVGVAPQAQGQQLASRLIRPFLEQADAQGMGAYTETVTPANVTLYEHYGFRVVEECPVTGTGLTCWGFYRPPVPRIGSDRP